MNQPAVLADLAAYAPAAAYLLVVTGLLVMLRRVPVAVHGVAFVLGVVVRLLQSGLLPASISAGVAMVVFVVLVLLAGATVSGVTLFSLVTTLALTPLAGWPGVVAGMVIAAVVAGWRTWRQLGKHRVAWLAMDTMSAVGVSPAGTLKRPELSLIPARDTLTDVHADSEAASRLRMYLPPYLLLGVALSAALTYLVD